MRNYDTKLGRFISVDPLFKHFAWNSTYAFAENDVIRAIDLDGGEKLIYTMARDKNGTWTSSKIELTEAGPLGNGVLVKFSKNGKDVFFYGNELPSTDGKEFTKFYEAKKMDKKGNHVAYKIPGEDFFTIGYGHAGQSAEDKLKYTEGTTITEKEAQEMFETDYDKRDVNIDGLDKFQIDAVNDFSFNTTDKGTKTENKFNKYADKPNFLLDYSKGGIGLFKRRAAEFILFSDKKYVGIDYSKGAQKKWQAAYNKITSPKK